MRAVKDTERSTVRIGYDGRVHKKFRGHQARERFDNECLVLRHLEAKGCHFVPRLLDATPDTLELITSNCGRVVEHLPDAKCAELFAKLESFGVKHDDPFARNITYRSSDGIFCIIDFEFASLLENAAVATVRRAAVKWTAATDKGPWREGNEDAFLVIGITPQGVKFLGREGEASLQEMDCLFAVSDGMGGMNSGEHASRAVRDRIISILPARCQPGSSGSGITPGVFTELFRAIHATLTEWGQKYPECSGMGATLTLALVTRTKVQFGHIGDSKLFLRRGEEFIQLSHDDTQVGWLRRNGKLNEREVRMHPGRHMLMRALGARHQYVDPQTGEHSWEAGETFMLCTDGVFEGLWERRIARDLDEGRTASELVAAAISEGSRDNSTAIVFAPAES